MLMVRLERMLNDLAVYRYYPEDKEDYGVISVNVHSGKIEEITPVEGPYGGNNSMYRNHAFSAMRKLFKKGEYPKESMVAWY